MVARASGHELCDLTGREELRLAGEAGSERDFGEVLNDLHAVKSGEEIGATSDRTVIGEEKCVVVGDVRFENGAEIGGAWSGITHKRNFAEADDDFGKEGLIEPLASSRESGCGGRVRVANGLDIRTHLIKEEVHARFRGNTAIATKVTALHIHEDEVVGGHHSFVEASGSGEDAIGIEAEGEIPFAGDDVAAFV